MAGLRIGIDVGGTFTHGVVLRPPGEVLVHARTPTTHSAAEGVAAGVGGVLRMLLLELERLGIARTEIELVAHSTTQATNALLEGDVSGVHLMALVPPGELPLVRRALGERLLDIGGGHHVKIWPKLLQDWQTATPEHFPASSNGADNRAFEASGKLSTLPEPDWSRGGWEGHGVPAGFKVSARLPVAVVQPLAGRHELREQAVAAHYRAHGHGAVCAGEITQVLGLKARARTAIVNAAMLPKMLATADYTERAVAAELPGVPLQVVRSDGGAMSIAEMRRQPVLSLLSGPAAGASAALDMSGLSEVVFIEVGGTSTDITLISEGRVRHRYATVGGQRLMVPALDLRTVAVGGGSMLRADKSLFGPRSAHVAGLPYLFQALAAGKKFVRTHTWDEEGVLGPQMGEDLKIGGATVLRQGAGTDKVAFYWETSPHGRRPTYIVAEMDDGSLAAFTMTDMRLAYASTKSSGEMPGLEVSGEVITAIKSLLVHFGAEIRTMISTRQLKAFRRMREIASHLAEELPEAGLGHLAENMKSAAIEKLRLSTAYVDTCDLVCSSIRELAAVQRIDIANLSLVGGGGGAPVIQTAVAGQLGLLERQKLIPHHSVISAIGAALAVTCVSLSRSVALPGPGDIAELTGEVEARLKQQGAERVATDFEFDAQRQVLTVTGRGSRPYEANARALSEAEMQTEAESLVAGAELLWSSADCQLWAASEAAGPGRSRRSAALSRNGRCLWLGGLLEFFPAEAGTIEKVFAGILDSKTQYTDGGPALPGLALLADGRFIPLDQVGSRELALEVLRWEKLPAAAEGCFILRRR